MCAEKVKIRAAVWIDGRQRQKVKYLPSQEAADQWKLDTERFMQQVKVIKEMETKVGQGSPQAQALRQVLKKEGRRALSVNDCLDLLDQAENFLRVHLGNELPFIMDGADLQEYFEKRIEQEASQDELAVESLLLKMFFQWCAADGSNMSNKVQIALDTALMNIKTNMFLNSHRLYVDMEFTESKEEHTLKAHQLSQQGFSQREIAKRLEISQAKVHRLLQKEVIH